LQELYCDTDDEPARCSIKKRSIGGSERRYWAQDIRIDGTVLSTVYSRVDFEYDPNEYTIQEIYIDVPSPFKEGDLVWYDGDYDSISIYLHDDAEWMRSHYSDRPFGCDTSDMTAHGITGDNEWLACDNIFQHTNLSYFSEELPANKLAMGLIHDYFAGERCLDGLIENIILLRSANALKERPGYIYDKRVIDIYKSQIERFSKDSAEAAKYRTSTNYIWLCKFIVICANWINDIDVLRYPYHEQIGAYIVINRYKYDRNTGYPDVVPEHERIYHSLPSALRKSAYIMFGSVDMLNDEVQLSVVPRDGATKEQVEYVRNFISAEFNLAQVLNI
jgi:hypothetical protein